MALSPLRHKPEKPAGREVAHDSHDREARRHRQCHGRTWQGDSCRGRKLRHDQEALRFDRRDLDRGRAPRLSRDAVPRRRRHEELRLRRHPLRRDDPPEGQGRHAARRRHQGGGRHSRHQGRRGRQGSRGPDAQHREGDRGPRRAARAPRRLLQARRALREVARGDHHRRRHARPGTASRRTRTRSRAMPRCARRPASCRSSSPRC